MVPIHKAVFASVLTLLFTKVCFTTAFQARKSPPIHKGCSSWGSPESDACCVRCLHWNEHVSLPQDKNNRGIQAGMDACRVVSRLIWSNGLGFASPLSLERMLCTEARKRKMKALTNEFFKKCSHLKTGLYISAAVFLPRKFIFDRFSDLFF